MNTNALLDIASQVTIEDTSSEASFHTAWQNNFREDFSPEQLAFVGGYLSGRLAWLFISGYQAAIRRTFPVQGSGWTAFAVSEDRSETNPLPGLIEADGLLSGNKTWIAAVEHIEQLIVTSQPDSKLWLCGRDLTGLTLETKQRVSFLSDMSQGIARFDQSPVELTTSLEPMDLRAFARREPLYLYIAFTGFLFRANQYDDDLLGELLEVAKDESDDMSVRQLFAQIDNHVTKIFNGLDAACFSGNYTADKGLMSMYSPAIQRRAMPRPTQ